MGKIVAGSFSGPSGKIGNLIGSSWRGISYFKARPEHFSDANTLRQQAVRMKFKLLLPFVKASLPFIRIGYLGYSSPTRTAYNAATSENLRNGITGEFPNMQPNFEKLMLSRGPLPLADEALAESTDAGIIDFTWSDVSQMPEAGPDDSALVLAYNPERKYAVYLLNEFTRGDGGGQLTVPQIFRGETMHCYLGFANLAKLQGPEPEKQISDSVYLGQVEVM